MQITFGCEHERVVLRRRLLLEHVERRAADLPAIRAPRAAPPRRRCRRARRSRSARRASSSRSAAAPSSPAVSFVFGTWTVIASARASSSSSETSSTSILAARRLGRDERVVARSPACRGPARARPRRGRCCRGRSTPSVRLYSSMPVNFGLLPLARLHRGGGLRDVARERDEQRDRVLGGRDVVALGRVHDHDAALRSRPARRRCRRRCRRARSRAAVGAAAITSAVTLVPLRITRPSASAMRSSRAPGASPGRRRPRCRARARGSRGPADASASLTRTFGTRLSFHRGSDLRAADSGTGRSGLPWASRDRASGPLKASQDCG